VQHVSGHRRRVVAAAWGRYSISGTGVMPASWPRGNCAARPADRPEPVGGLVTRDLRVRPDIVERASQDSYDNRAAVRAAGPRRTVVATLAGRDGTDNEPDEQDDRSCAHDDLQFDGESRRVVTPRLPLWLPSATDLKRRAHPPAPLPGRVPITCEGPVYRDERCRRRQRHRGMPAVVGQCPTGANHVPSGLHQGPKVICHPRRHPMPCP
jgi:hypothetical protein